MPEKKTTKADQKRALGRSLKQKERPANYDVMKRAADLGQELWPEDPGWSVTSEGLICAWAEDWPDVTYEQMELAMMDARSADEDTVFMPMLKKFVWDVVHGNNKG